MSVNTYNKGQQIPLTDHFTLGEFQCKGKNCGCTQVLHDPMLSCYLEMIRCHFGKPLIITSGYRCNKHNTAVGGATGSLHTKGQAADFYISGVAPLEIARYAEKIGVKGIGLYGQEDGNFVHIDTRQQKSFWLGHRQEKAESFIPAPEPSIYLVCCRVNQMQAVTTLVFDRALGDQIQTVPCFCCGVRMTCKDDKTEFEAMNLGTDTLQILQISPIPNGN